MSLAENEFTISYSRADILANMYTSDKIIATRLINKGMIPWKTTKAAGTEEITGWFFKLAPRDIIIKPLFQDVTGLSADERKMIRGKNIRLVPGKRADGVYLKDGLNQWMELEAISRLKVCSDTEDEATEEEELSPEILAELEEQEDPEDEFNEEDEALE